MWPQVSSSHRTEQQLPSCSAHKGDGFVREAGAAGPRFWGRPHLVLLSPSPAVQTQGSSLQEQDLALGLLLCPGAASCTAPACAQSSPSTRGALLRVSGLHYCRVEP